MSVCKQERCAGDSGRPVARVPALLPTAVGGSIACVKCMTCSALGGLSACCSVQRSVRRGAWPRKVSGVGVKVLGLVLQGLWWARLCLAGARYPLPTGLHRALGLRPSRLPELVPHWGALVCPHHVPSGFVLSSLPVPTEL